MPGDFSSSGGDRYEGRRQGCNIISHAMYMVRREELVERGDMVIFTAGDPATNEVTGEGYMTNMLHIIQAK